MAVANSEVIDCRIAMLYHCMANLTVYLLGSANLRSVDRHLRYPGKLRRHASASSSCSLCTPLLELNGSLRRGEP